jgi:hypothetical protein
MIEDYKVEAAMAELGSGRWTNLWATKQAMRAALEAADAAPPPPQIEATEAMLDAAFKVCIDFGGVRRTAFIDKVNAEIYRAMRALESKPEARNMFMRRSTGLNGVLHMQWVSDERSSKDRRDPYGLCLRKSQRRKTQGG